MSVITRKTRRLIGVLLILIVLPLAAAVPVIAQFGECNLNLSQIIGGLAEAQAAASSNDTSNALLIMRAAADALYQLADQCEAQLAPPPTAILPEATVDPLATVDPNATPEATQAAPVPGEFNAPNGAFSFDYPTEWLSSPFVAAPDGISGLISVGSSQAAIDALGAESPVLAASDQAVLIIGGTPAVITNDEIDSGGIEEILNYYQGVFRSLYTEASEPETFTVNDRRTGRLTVGGEAFDALLIVIELVPSDGVPGQGRYVVLVGTAAKGELPALTPIIESMAASLE